MQMIKYLGQEGKNPTVYWLDHHVYCNFIRSGLQTQGLFRVAGSVQRMKALQSMIEENGKIDSFEGFTAHDIAGIFKLFFRMLPEPLFTFKLYKIFLATESKLLV
jgi:hypothetical protein